MATQGPNIFENQTRGWYKEAWEPRESDNRDEGKRHRLGDILSAGHEDAGKVSAYASCVDTFIRAQLRILGPPADSTRNDLADHMTKRWYLVALR